MQAGGPSHRASTGSHASQPSKVLSDSAHSSSCTRPSSVKGKKRERPHHNTTISKRDQSAMSSENDPSPPKRECLAKVAEFGFITDKDGGLPNLSAVDHLIHLMRQESKKSIDAASQRGALVGLIAATQREDCLQHFVQLGGLSILDDWLPEGHKGKPGDGNLKDTDQIIDEVTLTILHALEKLPINLEALKACSIGKAVNHLRSHRFSEVQKRAKKLVETWKKRVDLEMETTLCESNGASGQAIGGYQKDITSFSAHLSPAKVGEDFETQKVSAESNNIAFSSDTTVTSGAGSSTSVNVNSSITQSCIGTRLHGNSSVSPLKQESSSKSCPSSNGSTMICSPTQKENEKNCVANRTSSNKTKSEDMTCSIGKQKMAEKVVVCGRNMYDSEPSGLPDTAIALGLNKGKNDHKNECSHDGSNDLFVSSMNTGLHVAAAPKHEKLSSGNTGSQRLLSVDDETSIGIEASSAPRQNSWSQLATDKENESKITKINMIQVNEWMENSRQDFHGVKIRSVYDNNERRTTESFAIDDKNEHFSPERGISNRSTVTTFGSDKGTDSTCPISLVETKNMKGMGCVEVKVMKENCTVGCTQSKEWDHLGLQGSEEKHSGDLNSCKWENFAQEQPSTVAGYTEGLTWQSSKVTGLEGDVVHPIQSTKEDSSGFNHLEDEHAKQSLPIKTTPACLDAKTTQSLEEDESGVAQDKMDTHLDGMDCENSSYSDCEAKKAGNAESRILQDFSSNTVHALIKNADSSDEVELLTSEKSPLDVSQEGNKDEKDKTKSLSSSSSKLQNIANETFSVFITENCSKNNEACLSPVGTRQSFTGSLKTSCGTTLIERPLEVTSGSVASPSNGSPQLVNAIILENTQPRHDFDLNEGLTAGELLRDSATPCVSAFISSSCTLSTPVAVVAATKGGFILPASSVHNRSEIGWKGSAATSAFRPAEPRRIPERSQNIPDTKMSSTTTVAIAKQFRNIFDFDLNVVDQGSSEDEMGTSSETYAEFQRSSLLHSCTYQFPSTNSRLVPQSANKIDIADFDLNRGGEEIDREIPPGSISETVMQQLTERQQKTSARPPMLDFDLNEGSVEEEVHEQVAHPLSATTSCTSLVNPLSVGELSGAGRSADISPWHQTCGSIPVVTLPGLNMARLEPAFSGAMTQPLFGQRQNSISNLPPSSAMIYPATAPFFGCTPIPFPASFTFNPLSIAPDSPFTVTALGTGIGMSSQAGGQRAVTPIVRPPFVMNIADLGAANGIYTWGRSDFNLTGSTGSTIINCRDLGASGKEQFLYHGGSASMEEQTRFIQQAALPVASLKRKEPECSWEQSRTAFKQPSCKHKSWH